MKLKLCGLAFMLMMLCAAAASALPAVTPEEEEAWKKEPAYGRTLKIGYNGGLCLGTFVNALLK
mgnify:FL=1